MDSREKLGLLLSGLAVGDALGATTAFTSRDEVIKLYEKHHDSGWPFKSVGNGYFELEPGQNTSDSQTAMIMAQSFIEHSDFRPDNIASRFVKWIQGNPKGVGMTTHFCIENLASGVPWHEGGLKDFQRRPMNASNGSLIRNGIIPAFSDSLDDTFKFSLYHGIMTHYGPIMVLCCAAQVWIIHEFLNGQNPLKYNWQKQFRIVWSEWLDNSSDKIVRVWMDSVAVQFPKAWTAFQETDFNMHTFSPFVYSPKGGAGYVLTALQIAVWATYWSLKNTPFAHPDEFPSEIFAKGGQHVLGWVAMTGGEPDSYGCVAGPMIAAAHGSIPEDLLEGMQFNKEFALAK